jgi:probable phosphoglycerate mutase
VDRRHRRVDGLPLRGPRDCPIPNAGLNRLRIERDAFEILAWGDDAHVSDLSAGIAPAPPRASPIGAAAAAQTPIAPPSPGTP